NRKQEYRDNYFPREAAQDTVLIIFDINKEKTNRTGKIQKVGDFEFEYVEINRTYPGENSCISLKFFHNPGPVWGHEAYLVNKTDLRNIKIICDEKKDFIFWFENTEILMEKTLILTSKEDWESKELVIKGLGVQVNTSGSCDDVID